MNQSPNLTIQFILIIGIAIIFAIFYPFTGIGIFVVGVLYIVFTIDIQFGQLHSKVNNLEQQIEKISNSKYNDDS